MLAFFGRSSSFLFPRSEAISSWISLTSCSFFSMPLMFSSYANFLIFCESANTSSTFTSASISARWMSFMIASTSFLSTKIALDIFLIPLFRAEPSLSSTIE